MLTNVLDLKRFLREIPSAIKNAYNLVKINKVQQLWHSTGIRLTL